MLLAQRAADEAVGEATAKSRQMLDDAEISRAGSSPTPKPRRAASGETERRRLEEEIVDLAGRRDTLLADVEALTRFEAEYRERMVRALEADLSALRSRPTTAPGTSSRDRATSRCRSRPTTPRRRATRPTSTARVDACAGRRAARRADAASTRAHAPTRRAAERRPSPSPSRRDPVESPTPVGDGDERSRRAHVVRAVAHDAAARVDVAAPTPVAARATAAVAERAASRARRAAAAAGRAPNASRSTSSSDGVDADVLDDDAFFATLRDAVHDETPLGPRDEDDVTGESTFFDQDAERGGFRDVFRRRR